MKDIGHFSMPYIFSPMGIGMPIIIGSHEPNYPLRLEPRRSVGNLRKTDINQRVLATFDGCEVSDHPRVSQCSSR